MASTWAHARAWCKCRSGQHFALFPDLWQQTHFTWISIHLFLKCSVFLYFHYVLWARLYKDGASSVGEFAASRHLVTCSFGFSVKMCVLFLSVCVIWRRKQSVFGGLIGIIVRFGVGAFVGIFALKQEFVCFYIEFCEQKFVSWFCGRWQEQILGVLWGWVTVWSSSCRDSGVPIWVCYAGLVLKCFGSMAMVSAVFSVWILTTVPCMKNKIELS